MLPTRIFSRSERLLMRTAISSFSARLRSKIARTVKRRKTPKPVNGQPVPAVSLPWIYLLQPSITGRDIAAVLEALAGSWNESSHLQRFEEQFRQYTGSPHALATSNCTGALHLALRAMGVADGDEVLVPELTWIATAAAVVYCGATPVFVDVDPQSWCMDPQSAARAITPRTKVILPVHQYGRPADMPALAELASKHQLRILEDAAGALGSRIDGKSVGTFGDAAAFSFHSTKMMTTAEGGMLVTRDAALFERIQSLARQGLDLKDPTRVLEIGLNYKMSHLHAALGLVQLQRIDELFSEKRRVYEWYTTYLRDIPGVALRAEPDDARQRSNCWTITVRLDPQSGLKPLQIMARLKAMQIASQPIATPLSSMPMFECRREENPVAYQVVDQALVLPSGLNLREADIARVCESLRQACTA